MVFEDIELSRFKKAPNIIIFTAFMVPSCSATALAANRYWWTSVRCKEFGTNEELAIIRPSGTTNGPNLSWEGWLNAINISG